MRHLFLFCTCHLLFSEMPQYIGIQWAQPHWGWDVHTVNSWTRLDTLLCHMHTPGCIKLRYSLRGVTGSSTAGYHGILGWNPGADIRRLNISRFHQGASRSLSQSCRVLLRQTTGCYGALPTLLGWHYGVDTALQSIWFFPALQVSVLHLGSHQVLK